MKAAKDDDYVIGGIVVLVVVAAALVGHLARSRQLDLGVETGLTRAATNRQFALG